MTARATLLLVFQLASAAWVPTQLRFPQSRHPHVRACTSSSELVHHLSRRLGCSVLEAQRAEARLGGRNIIPHRCGLVCDGLKQRLDLDDTELKKIVLARPTVLGLRFDDRVSPALDALQRRLGLSDAELRKVVVRLPTVLGYSVEANLAPKLTALEARLALSPEELRKIIVAQPSLLGLNFEKNIAPKLDFFMGAISLSTEEVRDRVVRMPAILTYSLAQRYLPRLQRCLTAGAPPVLVLDRVAYTEERWNSSVPLNTEAWSWSR
jgi:hypothetical protein